MLINTAPTAWVKILEWKKERYEVMNYLEKDSKYIWHPWRSNRLNPDTIFIEGKGCFVKDIEGKEYLDATSAVLNANCGISND